MDPITLVVSALVAGLTTGVTETAKTTVNEMYTSLKTRVQKKAEGITDVHEALNKVEDKPESKARQEVLKEELAKLKIEDDAELIELAEALLKKVDPQGTQSGKYNISITDAQGVVIGDHTQVEQHFGTRRRRKTQ